jgi:hypothetical protein
MRAFVAALGVFVICTQSALAAPHLGPGIHLDPGSPAAKEYVIPITGARAETSGGSPGTGSVGAATFGYGVTQAPASGSRAGANRSSRTRHRGAKTRSRSRAGAPRAAGSPMAVRAAALSADGGGDGGSSSWLLLAAGGALVLLLGCGGGLALTRRI